MAMPASAGYVLPLERLKWRVRKARTATKQRIRAISDGIWPAKGNRRKPQPLAQLATLPTDPLKR